MYSYRCIIRRIIDGDTIDVDVDLGFDMWLRYHRVRLRGIDAPESRTSDKVEEKFGEAAEQYLAKLLPIGEEFTIKSYKHGPREKYGRWLADILIDNTTVNELMMKNHHAVLYQSNKELMEQAHLQNRKILIEKGIVQLD